jgi:hypothetical protein
MAVSAATGVMSSLLSKLSVLLSDQYRQLKGARKDIEFPSRELTDMTYDCRIGEVSGHGET